MNELVSLMMFRLKVLDAKALGDPGVLGTADISLADAQLQPNSGPRDMWLPLKVRKWASHQPSDVHFANTAVHSSALVVLVLLHGQSRLKAHTSLTSQINKSLYPLYGCKIALQCNPGTLMCAAAITARGSGQLTLQQSHTEPGWDHQYS